MSRECATATYFRRRYEMSENGSVVDDDKQMVDEVDSPDFGDSSSTSEESKPVLLDSRLHELASIDASIATLLTEAASAIDALNPAKDMSGELSRRDIYAAHTDQFLDVLEV